MLITILAIVLFIVCVIESFVIFRLSRIIFGFEDKIEECLDVVDESYGSIAEVLEKPLFFDSPEIREVLNQIRKTNVALLEMAGNLAEVRDVADNVEE